MPPQALDSGGSITDPDVYPPLDDASCMPSTSSCRLRTDIRGMVMCRCRCLSMFESCPTTLSKLLVPSLQYGCKASMNLKASGVRPGSVFSNRAYGTGGEYGCAVA